MAKKELVEQIEAYLDDKWDIVLADIARLVEIESTENTAQAHEGAPFGPGPRRALDAMLDIASGMGFKTNDGDGYVGWAEVEGDSPTQIATIGHMDVVPAGRGWDFEPFALSHKDGYLIGRGVLDDKGPTVVCLHALKIVADYHKKPRYTLRALFGTNEESGMQDLPYYHEHNAEPAFIFTPDAEFPVGYGEKGGFDGCFKTTAIVDGQIARLRGGVATNAIPSLAEAWVSAPLSALKPQDHIHLEEDGELIHISAEGISGHASKPAGTLNALALLYRYLLDNNIGNECERNFMSCVLPILQDFTGEAVGLARRDDHFGDLTIIGGTAGIKDGCLFQTVDSRYPTTISDEELSDLLEQRAHQFGVSFVTCDVMKPFYVDPQSPLIQALCSSYNEVTGEDGKPFTMGGGTYARHFARGASFGPNRPWISQPDWVGPEHGPNEGIAEDDLKLALRVYALTLDKLLSLDFDER